MTCTRVLAIEDDPTDAALLRRHLASVFSIRYELSHEHTLAAGIERARAESFDVILLDSDLPDCHGIETLRRLRRQVPAVPTIVLTGYGDEVTGRDAVRLGAQDFLVKCRESWSVLDRAIEYAVHRSELQRTVSHADRLTTIGEIAAGVAHELNNPSAVLLLNQETIRQRLQGALAAAGMPQQARDDIAQALDILGENDTGLRRLRSVTKGLSLYSRLESEDAAELLELGELAREACHLLRAQVRHRATLHLELDTCARVLGDAQQLTQVLTNLIMNAAHAVGDPPAEALGTIRVCVAERDGHATLRVEDDGPGIEPRAREHLFERFFTTKPRGEGTGLGLAVSMEIVRRHGGTLRSDDSELGGALFEVRLPVDRAEPLHAPREQGSVVPDPGEARVLILDDEVPLLRAYERALGLDCDVTTCTSATEALKRLAQDSDYHLVLCDLMMPDMDGPTFYRELLKRVPKLAERTVFVTGGAVTQRCRDFVETVPEAVVYKPIGPEALRALVAEYQRRARRPVAQSA